MPIRVALNHKTEYHYDRPVAIFPQTVRLRPAPHCRTPILSYSLKVAPEKQFVNWQQDPHGNFLARFVFPDKSQELSIEVDLVAEMTVVNPFDFFLEPSAETFPFGYDPVLAEELKPFLATTPLGPHHAALLASIDRTKTRSVDFLVMLNNLLHERIKYVIRMDPGVQTCEQTLGLSSGSCRDTAWLLVQTLRNLGLAARFVSGYLIQLTADIKSLDGPAGPAHDFTDLHAWAEVYLPGAGWIGLDATSGLWAGEGHIPLAATPEPASAAAVTGAVDTCEATFNFAMSVSRIHEDPRVTKPYTEEQWQRIESLGHRVDADLETGNVRLTMGGEPTFVSIDDMDGPEWNTLALGKNKRLLAGDLTTRLRNRFAADGLLHTGQGKWYPGESLPRWSLACYWRKDGQPIWHDSSLLADDRTDYGFGDGEARTFIAALAGRLGVPDFAEPGYEDVWHYLWKEGRLPVNVDPLKSKLESPEDRKRLAKIFTQGLGHVVGYALPLSPQSIEGRTGTGSAAGTRWESRPWRFRGDRMYLIPGDSPMGLRLPLDRLPWSAPEDREFAEPMDPFAPRAPLPPSAELSRQRHIDVTPQSDFGAPRQSHLHSPIGSPLAAVAGSSVGGHHLATSALLGPGGAVEFDPTVGEAAQFETAQIGQSATNGHGSPEHAHSAAATAAPLPAVGQSAREVIRTALCVEVREGRLHVFMPPLLRLEDYLALVAAVESTAAELSLPVVVEGYPPPHDHRLMHFKVTPDPGVIEVNIQPAYSWDELVQNTTALYEDARQSRLGTEKFMIDGRHTGTGGGNHVVLGGPTPADSPFLRRPDLLRSLLAYWNNHPSLSYLFCGTFVGPTSQSPRIDEARNDSLYELEIAFQQIPDRGGCPPWLVDRVFRHLLTDLTGNTHRAEFCIDKLFSPDTSTGRLGLLEFRAFEMPPHARMSLTQQLLIRALISRFWRTPYRQPLVRWGTILHDRYLLPHFVAQDFADVIADLKQAGYRMEAEWFAPHLEFRFPVYGDVVYAGVQLELRAAIELWNVLGEEPGGGGTARYVDSSVERLQVKVGGMTDPRHIVTCNGRRVPLHPTGTAGEFVAGVRYRAWQPPSCLHPTIPVHAPLVFDVFDTWSERSIGGCTWHVAHPGGRSYETFPVNANEAESRRVARFFKMGHTPGQRPIASEECNCDFPLTLDLRRS